MEFPTEQPAKERSRVACKTCRQAKVRCGMRQPPCSRCVRLKKSCTLDATFRRVSKTERFQQLEEHVQELRGLVEKQSGASPNSSMSAAEVLGPTFTIDEAAAWSQSSTGDHPRIETPPPHSQLSQRPSRHSVSDIYTIDNVTLSHKQADTLLAL